jgi:uncharacterized membrane protein
MMRRLLFIVSALVVYAGPMFLLLVISAFVYAVYDREGVLPRREFYSRVVATYVVTLLICASLLVAIDRLDLFVNTTVAIKRTVLVAFPASFSATVVDSIIK